MCGCASAWACVGGCVGPFGRAGRRGWAELGGCGRAGDVVGGLCGRVGCGRARGGVGLRGFGLLWVHSWVGGFGCAAAGARLGDGGDVVGELPEEQRQADGPPAPPLPTYIILFILYYIVLY